jgi:hypothetical protein
MAKRKKHKLTVSVKTFEALLPPAPDRCQECASKHEAHEPHNRDSLFYQMKFQMKHKRWPTWQDVMAHCSEEVKAAWKEELAKLGLAI